MSAGVEQREGIVIRAGAGHCQGYVAPEQVHVAPETWQCQVRGRLKKGPKQVQSLVVAGDRVRFEAVAGQGPDGREGIVEEVLPRRNRISRMAARRSGGRIEQVLMANLDQLVVVQSVRDPEPQTGFVDRLLAAALRFDVHGVVIVNKVDLCGDDAARRRELFEKLPDQRLAAAHAVDIGRIEEVHAGRERPPHQAIHLGLAQGPDGLPEARIGVAPEGHGPQAELGNKQTRAAQLVVFHGGTPWGTRGKGHR